MFSQLSVCPGVSLVPCHGKCPFQGLGISGTRSLGVSIARGVGMSRVGMSRGSVCPVWWNSPPSGYMGPRILWDKGRQAGGTHPGMLSCLMCEIM